MKLLLVSYVLEQELYTNRTDSAYMQHHHVKNDSKVITIVHEKKKCTLLIIFYRLPNMLSIRIHKIYYISSSDISSNCASCSFFDDSTAEGCAIELSGDNYSFLFSIFHHNNEKHKLECFPVPEAGVYSAYTYEKQFGIHSCMELHSVTIIKPEGDYKRDQH